MVIKCKTTGCAGFTLVELMIAVAVLSILLGLGVPSFRSMTQNNRASAVTNDLVAALHTARSVASARRANVMVCRRNPNGDACANGADWSVGWLLLSQGAVLRLWDPARGDANVSGPTGGVTFQRDGGATVGQFTVSLPDCTGDAQRTIAVSATGRVSTARAACP